MTTLPLVLLDPNGRPLAPHLAAVLLRLVPRLQRTVAMCRDDLVLLDVLEQAGQKLALRERQRGLPERLHAYAWVTLRSVALSRARLGRARLAQHLVTGDAGARALAVLAARWGSPEAIERRILLRELVAQLSPDEQQVVWGKYAGYSSQELADRWGLTPAAVDKRWSRALQTLRRLVGVGVADAPLEADPPDQVQRHDARTARRVLRDVASGHGHQYVGTDRTRPRPVRVALPSHTRRSRMRRAPRTAARVGRRVPRK